MSKVIVNACDGRDTNCFDFLFILVVVLSGKNNRCQCFMHGGVKFYVYLVCSDPYNELY